MEHEQKQVSYVPCILKIHQFVDTYMDLAIFFQVILLKENYIIWVGQQPAAMNQLSVSMPTNFVCFIMLL